MSKATAEKANLDYGRDVSETNKDEQIQPSQPVRQSNGQEGNSILETEVDYSHASDGWIGGYDWIGTHE